MRRAYSWFSAALFFGLSACGDTPNPQPAIEMLDPHAAHFGKTYSEWAAEWVDYVYRFEPPQCADPLTDSTGEQCALNQDPASPVFFLVGTLGGPVTRRDCVVPQGKALFFPLSNTWSDSAGVEPGDLPEDLKSYVETGGDYIVRDSLYARVDGREVINVERGFMEEAAPYRLEFPPEPNTYTCIGTEGVVGAFSGYIQGAWVMLPPLDVGKHVIEFGGAVENVLPNEADFRTDARYELIVE